MLYKIEMEFAGGNDSEFRDAYLGWRELPVLQTLLIGNQKRPYGLDHLNSSRYNVFLERPFIIESFNQDARRLGVVSYGVSEDEAWNWRYGVYNQRLIQDEGNYTNDHLQLEFAARLANTFWYDEVSDGRGYGHWAVSGSFANPDGQTGGDNGGTGPDQNEARFRHRPEARSATRWIDTGRIAGADNYQLLGLEGALNFGPLQFVSEYQNIWLDRDGGSDLNFNGAYAQVSYFLTGEHMPWERDSGTLGRIKPFEDFFLVRTCDGGLGRGWGAWQVAARWSYADLNDDDILGGEGESLTLGLNWYWTENARMQFNYIIGEIDNNAVTRGVPLSGDYEIIGARFMVDF
jgi:phosphate-selective porin OprO/OprP